MNRLISLFSRLFQSDNENEHVPFQNVEEVIKYIRLYSGKAVNLKLKISDSLNDPIGMNMAMITDEILNKGFEPNGFISKDGYKIYLYN